MRAEVFLQGLISFLIVAFGIPSFSSMLGPVAAVVGYALFWKAIRIYPFAKQRFWRAFLWYGAISLVQLSWMTSIEYQGIYILFIWIFLSVCLGLQFGFLSILIPYNRPLKIPRIFAIASLWTIIEWSRYYILCGYSWNLVGVSFCNTPAMQAAAVFGVLGLSFWAIFVNLMGLRAFLKKGIPNYCIWIVVALLPYLFGMGHIVFHEKRAAKSPLYSCVLVQTGLLPSEKTLIQGRIRSFISPYEQWQRILVYLKEFSAKKVDLIVLPEAAVPFTNAAYVYDQNIVKEIFSKIYGPLQEDVFPEKASCYGDGAMQKVSNQFWAQTLSNYFKSEVVLGLDHFEEGGGSHNSAFHFVPFHTRITRYDKRVLMPLAEYLPFRCLAPLVKNYGITDFFAPGKEATLFYGKIPLSATICYEETFPHKVREGRLKGGRLFVNVTNDGWYPFSRLPNQHLEHAKFRAIENGVPLVRACNTGVTAAVDSLGRCLSKIEQQDNNQKLKNGALFTNICLYTYPTLFLYWGNMGILLICFIFLGIFFSLKKTFDW